MNAPIKYFGGKGLMFKHIIENFPTEGSYDTYIEPFGGSYSVGLKKPEVPIEIYNDLEQNVYSLYKVLSDETFFNVFKMKCDLAFYSEDMRKELKDSLKRDDLGLIDRAFNYFYVNRTSHNGIGGFSLNTVVRRNMSKSASDYLSSIDRLPELHNKLSRVVMLNTDGIKLMEKYNKPNVLIYADPPYEHSTRGLTRYKIDMDNDLQERFLNVALKSKSKVLISGYDNEMYERLVDGGFTKKHFTTNNRVETLWKNY